MAQEYRFCVRCGRERPVKYLTAVSAASGDWRCFARASCKSYRKSNRNTPTQKDES